MPKPQQTQPAAQLNKSDNTPRTRPRRRPTRPHRQREAQPPTGRNHPRHQRSHSRRSRRPRSRTPQNHRPTTREASHQTTRPSAHHYPTPYTFSKRLPSSSDKLLMNSMSSSDGALLITGAISDARSIRCEQCNALIHLARVGRPDANTTCTPAACACMRACLVLWGNLFLLLVSVPFQIEHNHFILHIVLIIFSIVISLVGDDSSLSSNINLFAKVRLFMD